MQQKHDRRVHRASFPVEDEDAVRFDAADGGLRHPPFQMCPPCPDRHPDSLGRRPLDPFLSQGKHAATHYRQSSTEEQPPHVGMCAQMPRFVRRRTPVCRTTERTSRNSMWHWCCCSPGMECCRLSKYKARGTITRHPGYFDQCLE